MLGNRIKELWTSASVDTTNTQNQMTKIKSRIINEGILVKYYNGE